MPKLVKVTNHSIKKEKTPFPEQVDGRKLRAIAERQRAAESDSRKSRRPSTPKPVCSAPPIVPEPTDGARLITTARLAESDPPKVVVSPTAPVKLGSRSCEIDRSGRKCTECPVFSKMVFIYEESNKGRVELCERCNAAALDRSFGQDDAMEHTGLPSGKADANRPRIRMRK